MQKINRKYVSFPLLFCVISFCCTSTFRRPEIDQSELFLKKVNAYGDLFEATVTLTSGYSFKAQNLNVQMDSTSYELSESNQFSKISTADIQSIEFRSATTGAIGGLTIGLLCGVGIAISAIYLSADENSGDANFGPMFALIYGTLIGSLSGAIIGAIIEDRKVFIINPDK
jgi:hypothetical protein